MIIEFEIPGKIKGKQRPRFANGHTYTPQETVNYENWIKHCYLQHYKAYPCENAIIARIDAYFVKPKSNKLHEPTTVRIDADNIGKSVLDALNGLAYKDDKQIICLTVNKRWGETEKVIVQLSYCF